MSYKIMQCGVWGWCIVELVQQYIRLFTTAFIGIQGTYLFKFFKVVALTLVLHCGCLCTSEVIQVMSNSGSNSIKYKKQCISGPPYDER